MRELIDCHIHTERCGHASGTVAQAVSAAVFRGLTGMVLTEHLPLPEDLDPSRHLAEAVARAAAVAFLVVVGLPILVLVLLAITAAVVVFGVLAGIDALMRAVRGPRRVEDGRENVRVIERRD